MPIAIKLDELRIDRTLCVYLAVACTAVAACTAHFPSWDPHPIAGAPVFKHFTPVYRCVLTPAKAVLCAGSNEYGQLGDGTLTDRSEPAPVKSDLRFDTVATGEMQACALSAGDLYCWGDRSYGRRGGPKEPWLAPTRIANVPALTTISAGMFHTCGLTRGGAAYCWGSNRYGELGDGTNNNHDTPTPVANHLVFQSISAGAFFTCALTHDGVAYCWGHNDRGQLGNGGSRDQNTPNRVIRTPRFVRIVTDFSTACGFTAAGITYCWGFEPSRPGR